MDFVLIFIAYIFGSVPFGLVSKYIFKIDDPRTYGSKNIGATNILRSGNRSAALFTLTFDMSKGLLTVIFVRSMELDYMQFFITAVILGHIFPIFLFFKGGKGVATFFGVLVGLSLISGILTLTTWLVIFIFFRKSSLAALISIIFSNLFLFFLYEDSSVHLTFLIITVVVLYKHKENIKRILKKEELSFENREKN